MWGLIRADRALRSRYQSDLTDVVGIGWRADYARRDTPEWFAESRNVYLRLLLSGYSRKKDSFRWPFPF